MATSTGPVLALGAITMANQTLLNNKPVDLRIPVAVGVLALVAAGAERLAGPAVTSLAWLALVTSLVAPVGNTPSPVESLVRVLGLGK